MKRIIGYFLKGLLVFVPAAITISLIIWAFTTLDNLLGRFLIIHIPGTGLVIIIAAITLIGFFASNFIGQKFFLLIDRLFTRLPLVKLLYSSLKDFIEAFAGEKKSFDRPVLVELMPGGAKAAGFITRDSLENIGLDNHVAVYFPQSYNFAGSVLIFESSRVTPLDVESSKVMAFIVSGGVAGDFEKDIIM
ncbi:MAG: DUF502 domain-containing protein [Anaerohalosphaeraceae bacterium]|nr:DUF502 domain-containing protein [Anaerohalosphaeraceae bacterium]